MRYFIVIAICLYSFTIKAQDIAGTWEEQNEDRYTNYTKLCIVNICGKYFGYTYDRDKKDGNCKANFFGTYNKRRQSLRGETMDFIGAHTYGHVLAIYDLDYRREGRDEILEGNVYQKPDSLYQMIDGIPRLVIIQDHNPEFIRLVKTSGQVMDSTAYMKLAASKPCKTDTAVISKPPPVVVTPVEEKPVIIPIEEKKPEKPVVDSPVVISLQDIVLQLKKDRINDTLSVLPITEKELLIKVMDNAITDGDTISIIHNGKIIAEKLPVTGRAYPVKILLSKEDPYHELTLVAHNLGSIPPNTALLVISYGNKEVKLYAFADLKKNAVIIFRYTGE